MGCPASTTACKVNTCNTVTGACVLGNVTDGQSCGTNLVCSAGSCLSVASLGLALQAGQTTSVGIFLLGETKTTTFILTNNGQQTASGVSVTLTPPPATPTTGFSRVTGAATDCGTSLTGMSSCQLRVLFTGPGQGGFGVVVGVTATVGGTTATFTLTARGINAPTIDEFSIPTASSSPQGITGASDGTIWFSEGSVSQLGRLIPTTGKITEFLTPSPPLSLLEFFGTVWFTEPIASVFGNSDLNGNVTQFPTVVGQAPGDVALGGDGALWFTEGSNRIGHMTFAGAFTEFPVLTAGASLQSICFGPDRNMWFTEQLANKIGRILTSDQTVTEFTVPTAGSAPTGIAFGVDGRVWFTELGGNKIGAIDPTTQQISEYPIPTANSQPRNLVAANDMWFVETAGNKVALITTDGSVKEFAIPTPDSFPWDITTGTDGRVYFTELNGNKIGRIIQN